MKPDPIDELGARLFEAARREPVPERALERALFAAREARSTAENAVLPPRAALFGLAAAALVAGAALFLMYRGETVSRISAEPALSVRLDREPQPPSSNRNLTEPSPSVTTVAPPAPSAAPISPPPVHSAATSLSDELAALNTASSALRSGDAQAALSALDHYDRMKGQKMRAEATLLRVEALSRAGQADAASKLAAQFVEKNPESPLVDRARSFIVVGNKAGK